MLPTTTTPPKKSNPFPALANELESDALSSGISLQEYVAILRRRRAIIIQAFVLIAVVGIAVTLLTKPVYQASGELLIDNPGYNMNQVDSNNPISGLLTINQPQSPETVVEVLATPQLLQRVIQISGPAEFDTSVKPNTNVILVLTEAGDPKVAALAANELMRQYIAQESDQDLSGIERNYEFIKKQKVGADAAYKIAQSKLSTFRNKHDIIQFDHNRDDKIARVSGLTTDLMNERIQLAVLQAKTLADQQAIAAQPATTAVVLPSTNPRISELQGEIRALEVQRESMTQPGGLNPAGHAPALVALDAQIAELRRQLAAQPALLDTHTSSPNALRETLRGSIVEQVAQVAPLRTQIAQTSADLAAVQADLARYPNWEAQLDALTQNRDSSRTAVAKLGQQLADLSLREQARQPAAHVIQAALIPQTPIRPKKGLNILFSCLIGLFIGICLALLQEFLDDRINTTEDADRVLGLPSLGYVPLLTANDARLLPQMQSMDPSWESYRVLRTNINFASIDSPLRTLLVTSTSAGEGKTTTAVNLAFAMVMDGKKVILLDTDLRRPSVHKMLGLPAMPGVTDVLLGHAKLGDVIMQHSDMPGLMALTCGSTPPNPSELLGSRAFKNLVEELQHQADIVILDSPPVLAAADAQILAAQVDGVVMVVEMGETKKSAARHTLALLRHARANVLGVAHNRMKVLNHEYYYYRNYSSGAAKTAAVLPGDVAMDERKAQKSLPAAMEADDE